MMLIFDKILVSDNTVFLKYFWPANMFLISVASFRIFADHGSLMKIGRNIFSFFKICMPFGYMYFGDLPVFMWILLSFFLLFYIFIFGVVMYQITLIKEIRINVIIGSICGYMLLSMIGLFSYLLIAFSSPTAFHGLTAGNTGLNYNELSYFSFITLTSIGFGDIYPTEDRSRLLVAFFGMLGQFYMVAVVGIIVSRFSSK
jgi:voltage-gated potassium channel